uniref:PB1-F2 protein n=4 Tax=Influenza A virus TaxID=11320 RepID=V5QZP6_9INFA|nr:PB1-F2 protein [Influenza A virus (A/swine/Georgia/SG1251/2006(H1N1))]AHB24680.1 PB1-F2 protein [Influenza A virus (A/swine/Quebec/00729/2005(H3))]AHB24695.1 PB1-F2 protein [Influenza A virus (A/swine/Quebec/01000/2006(H3N2))]AHB51972.1 PB1-F2 protein [Influenza A virus (A/swine/Minnesota/SG1177/2003(H1N1))]
MPLQLHTPGFPRGTALFSTQAKGEFLRMNRCTRSAATCSRNFSLVVHTGDRLEFLAWWRPWCLGPGLMPGLTSSLDGLRKKSSLRS